MKLENKSILITGAEGFIGSHLVEKMVEIGSEVTALVQYNSFGSWGWLDTIDSNVRKNIRVEMGDVREFDSIQRIIANKDVVFHLAALIAIPYSYKSPMAYVKTNIEGTVNTLESCRIHNVQKLIHTSTSETYGSALYTPIDESHPLQGQSPYSASKIAADKMVESYFKSFCLPVATVRPFNTYGPRQSARAIIPTVISQIYDNNLPIKLGSLSPIRDFNYIKDTVEAFIKVAESDKAVGEVLNAGSGKEISIGNLVELIFKLMDRPIDIDVDENRLRPEKSEVNRLLADNKKILEYTGWKPRYDLEQGLTETIEWIKDNIKYFKSDIYNV